MSMSGVVARRARRDYRRAIYTNRALLFLCIAFALSSSFSRIGLFDLANKAIIAFMCLAILVFFNQRAQPKYSYLILAITGGLHAISLAFPLSPKDGIATYFTFAFWVLFWLYLAQNIEMFIKAAFDARDILQSALKVWTCVTAFSFLLPFCYKYGWGGGRYFTSFTTDSFEIAPVAMFMLALNILLFSFDKNRVKALTYSAVPLACVFAAGTRTYLIVVMLEFILLLRMIIEKPIAFWVALAGVLLACFYIAAATNIGQKFESAMFETTDVNVFLEVFTNGRSEFWQVDLKAFLSSDWFTKLFGHGFSYVYELNLNAIGMRLYAHNDFLNVLLNFGIIGLLVYLASFFPIMSCMKRIGGVSWGLCGLFFVMWLFNAFFNMIYVYAVAVIAMGVLAAAMIAAGKESSWLPEGESGSSIN